MTKNNRYTSILVLPFIIGAAVTILWAWVLYENNIYFSEEAEAPLFYMIMPLVGFVYVIFASLAVQSALTRYDKLNRSVTRNDLEAYLESRDQPMPLLLQGLVAVPSLALMFLALFYKYIDLHAGIGSVFIVTVLVSLTWLVITELNSVHRRKYFRRSAPDHWHEKTAREYFKSK